jgi:hypothetical protein
MIKTGIQSHHLYDDDYQTNTNQKTNGVSEECINYTSSREVESKLLSSHSNSKQTSKRVIIIIYLWFEIVEFII